MLQIILYSLLSLIVLGVLIYLIIIFNALKRLKFNIDKAWADISVLLKQRFDEIPQLVNVCKGYINYENEVLQKLVQLRKKFEFTQINVEKEALDEDFNFTIEKLNDIAEGYPDLKTQPLFIKLQNRLTDLENQIADRRELYNDYINAFNSRIESFPELVFAGIFGFKKKEMFKIN